MNLPLMAVQLSLLQLDRIFFLIKVKPLDPPLMAVPIK